MVTQSKGRKMKTFALALLIALCLWRPMAAGAATLPGPSATGLQAINAARAREGVKPMVVPNGFDAMPAEEQLLIVANLERVDRGLRPFAGTVARLDALAQQGAQTAQDPPTDVPYGNNWRTESIEAQVPDLLTADYDWMYADGWDPNGSINGDCTSPDASGCWAHRHAILTDFGSLPTLIMGAAVAPGGPDANPVFAILFLGTDATRPHLRY
jgi:hypothetical protein